MNQTKRPYAPTLTTLGINEVQAINPIHVKRYSAEFVVEEMEKKIRELTETKERMVEKLNAKYENEAVKQERKMAALQRAAEERKWKAKQAEDDANAKKEAEEKAKKDIEAKAKKDAEEKTKKEAKEKLRKDAEEKKKKLAEVKEKREAERKKREEETKKGAEAHGWEEAARDLENLERMFKEKERKRAEDKTE
uniref:TolA protein n=1 Tax=Globodera pallida TaxID=36090 RepID=A0A183CP89_GLOPA